MNLSGKWKQPGQFWATWCFFIKAHTGKNKQTSFCIHNQHLSVKLQSLTVAYVGWKSYRKDRIQIHKRDIISSKLLNFLQAKCFWRILDANKLQLYHIIKEGFAARRPWKQIYYKAGLLDWKKCFSYISSRYVTSRWGDAFTLPHMLKYVPDVLTYKHFGSQLNVTQPYNPHWPS